MRCVDIWQLLDDITHIAVFLMVVWPFWALPIYYINKAWKASK